MELSDAINHIIKTTRKGANYDVVVGMKTRILMRIIRDPKISYRDASIGIGMPSGSLKKLYDLASKIETRTENQKVVNEIGDLQTRSENEMKTENLKCARSEHEVSGFSQENGALKQSKSVRSEHEVKTGESGERLATPANAQPLCVSGDSEKVPTHNCLLFKEGSKKSSGEGEESKEERKDSTVPISRPPKKSGPSNKSMRKKALSVEKFLSIETDPRIIAYQKAVMQVAGDQAGMGLLIQFEENGKFFYKNMQVFCEQLEKAGQDCETFFKTWSTSDEWPFYVNERRNLDFHTMKKFQDRCYTYKPKPIPKDEILKDGRLWTDKDIKAYIKDPDNPKWKGRKWLQRDTYKRESYEDHLREAELKKQQGENTNG